MAIANAVDAGTAGYQVLTSAGVWNGRTFQAGTGISLTNADGTAGNTTIASTGGSTGQNSTLDFWDDFMYYSPNTTLAGENVWKTSAAGPATTVAGHPGIVVFSSAGGYLYKSPDTSSNNSIILGSGVLTITFYIKLLSLTTFQISAGLTDAAGGGADSANGVYFLGSNALNSANWVGKTANASTRSTANSSTAITTGWTVLQIVVNAAASSVAFNVGTTLANVAAIANSPLTSNIPTVGISPQISFAGAASGNPQAYVDLITMNYALTTAR